MNTIGMTYIFSEEANKHALPRAITQEEELRVADNFYKSLVVWKLENNEKQTK